MGKQAFASILKGSIKYFCEFCAGNPNKVHYLIFPLAS